MTDYERIKKVLDYLSLNARALSINLNLSSPQIFYDIKAGKCGISKDIANKIQDKFFISASWLLTGEGEMLKESAQNNEVSTDSDIDYVPLLPVEAMAGTLQGFSEGVELKNCRKIKAPVKGADWVIQISGDSMEPDYKNGSFLYIKKMSGTFIPWGHTLVLDTLDGVIVKDIYPVEDNEECIEARSINKKYPPFKIEKSIILGIYRVLGGSFINSTL